MPELIKEKWRIYVALISTTISVTCVVVLLFYNIESLLLSKTVLKLVDNVIFPIWMGMSLTYCVMSFSLLEKLEMKDIQSNKSCLSFKKSNLFLMTIQFIVCKYKNNFIDSVSMVLISFYNPLVGSEIFLVDLMIVCMFINSVLFVLSNILFIYSLKYDLDYVKLNLLIQPDLEYFIDLEGAIKSQL